MLPIEFEIKNRRFTVIAQNETGDRVSCQKFDGMTWTPDGDVWVKKNITKPAVYRLFETLNQINTTLA